MGTLSSPKSRIETAPAGSVQGTALSRPRPLSGSQSLDVDPNTTADTVDGLQDFATHQDRLDKSTNSSGNEIEIASLVLPTPPTTIIDVEHFSNQRGFSNLTTTQLALSPQLNSKNLAPSHFHPPGNFIMESTDPTPLATAADQPTVFSNMIMPYSSIPAWNYFYVDPSWLASGKGAIFDNNFWEGSFDLDIRHEPVDQLLLIDHEPTSESAIDIPASAISPDLRTSMGASGGNGSASATDSSLDFYGGYGGYGRSSGGGGGGGGGGRSATRSFDVKVYSFSPLCNMLTI